MTELGVALRRWRDALPPERMGVLNGRPRRTTGLRREELAGLAGISVDYVTRLEQGRAAHPSSQVVEALASALRLDDAERRHLFLLAGLAPPGRGEVPRWIPPSVYRLLDRFAGIPVSVSDATWTLLLANAPYVALMGEYQGKARNSVWRNFLGSGSRVRYTPQAQRDLDAEQVGDLRTTAHRYPEDAWLQALLTELRTGSERFAALWDAGGVRQHEAARKSIEHPAVGPLTLDCDLLTVAGHDLRVMVYTAEPGSADEQRLAEVVG